MAKDDAPASQRRRCGLPALAGLGALAALALTAAPAAAEDLIVNAGQPDRTISGVVRYDVVYIEGGLNLAADTTIIASQVYIGSAAQFRTCFVLPATQNGCTAGRNLTITSASTIVIEQGITLTGAVGTTRPGGNLTLVGTGVSIGGPITTAGAGTAAPSGDVSIVATAGAVVTEGITAPGRAIRLNGSAGVAVGGGLSVNPVAATPLGPYGGAAANAGLIDVVSAGDVGVAGALDATGGAGVAGNPIGGNAGAVTVSGAGVGLGNVNVRPGAGQGANPAGVQGVVAITATEGLAAGTIDVSAGTGSPGGGNVALTAGGHTSTGAVNAAGANGGIGSPGGSIAITTTSASLGAVSVSGGNSTGGGVNGAAAGGIVISGKGVVVTGPLTANGGSSGAGAAGANGGVVDVTGRSIVTGPVNVNAGTSGTAGAWGGRVRLWADGSLSVVSTTAVSVSANASTGAAAAGLRGGNGGTILMRAAAGTLSTSGAIRASGSAGGPIGGTAKGGAGGNGGTIDLVAGRLGSIGAVVGNGGAGGAGNGMQATTQGAGGAGATVRTWTQDTIIDFRTQLMAEGGSGSPLGPDGSPSENRAPTSLSVDPATGALNFSNQSLDGDGFHVLRTVAGGALESVLDTSSSTGVTPPAPPLCVDVAYSVQAFATAVGWASDVLGPVTYQRQPSATQTCVTPPGLKVGKTLKVKLKALKKGKWKLNVTVNVAGVGTLTGKLLPKKFTKKTRPLVTVTRDVAAGGKVKLAVVFPKAARKVARFVLQIETRAPLGTAVKRGSVNVEVLK